MLGGLLVVGLLVAGFGIANILRPALFAGRDRPVDGLQSDGGEPNALDGDGSDANDGLLLKNRVMGACCVVFGGIVVAVALV
jgi:hypothetical protein